MIGLGTIVNTAAVVAGGTIGILGGRFISESIKDSLTKACGVSTLFISIAGALTKMLTFENGSFSSHGEIMMILSLVIGVLIGELLKLEDKMEGFGEWLKQKSGNGKDSTFVNAFVTTSLTICIGAMAVVGSIQDGIAGDHSTLFAKAILDFTIVIMFAASLGKGAIFSAISIALFQGSITLFSRLLEPIMNDAALANLSLVGNVMIFCVGVNIIWGKKFKVGNFLPGLIVAVIFAYL